MKTLQRALIREDECIGCAKCLTACPVDAIIGAQKFMHTVITDECIGCQLCVAPCPVDCIEMYEIPLPSAEMRKNIARQARKRVKARKLRLVASDAGQQNPEINKVASNAAAEIAAAIARVKVKKCKEAERCG
ncbi:MAG TPA: RnfABCDGE type electron transport complex subunit B [Gammaproteobacteria bacterium]|nr:RnfABCDGE type electron transport complex subunit B [Gammaproteobacteria bacterium]